MKQTEVRHPSGYSYVAETVRWKVHTYWRVRVFTPQGREVLTSQKRFREAQAHQRAQQAIAIFTS